MEVGGNLTTFKGFDKMPRLFGECVITEKIDGTNAVLRVVENDGRLPGSVARLGKRNLFVGRRRGWLMPGHEDNFGFRAWCEEHAEELIEHLPKGGTLYGEWYGKGIGRGYGLEDRRLVLFSQCGRVPGLFETIPVIHEGPFSLEILALALQRLENEGSLLVPGQPAEGIVIAYPVGPYTFRFKLTFDSLEDFGISEQGDYPWFRAKSMFHKGMKE